jgi:hypothetical protein
MTAPDADTRRLDAALAEFIASAPPGFAARGATRADRWGVGAEAAAALDAKFDSLALELYAYQSERVAVYRDYVTMSGRAQRPRRAADVPALPIDAFKRTRVAGFAPEHERLAFHTSGTTAAQTGILSVDDPALYELSLERGFRHHVVPDRDSIRILVVAASAAEAPHSSLSYMFDHVRRRCGGAGSDTHWQGGRIRWRALAAALVAAQAEHEPVCLLGTAFTWVHVVDTCRADGFRVRLPAGSRLLETGGYKGRSRTLARHELLAEIQQWLGIPPSHVVSEYGMTEMGSQYYTTSLRSAVLGVEHDGVWSHPAWLRPRSVDSETGDALELESAHEVGLLAHHDLANRGSVAHLQSADLGRPRAGSFDLLGRAPRAEPRGCGLAYETQEPAA